MADAPRTWVLTGSPDDHAATAAHDFGVIAIKAIRPAGEHRKLASRGRLRTVSQADALLLMDRVRAAAGAAA